MADSANSAYAMQIARYRAVRARLRDPRKVIRDDGIDLQRGRLPGWFPACHPPPPPLPTRPPSIRKVHDMVAHRYGITVVELLGTSFKPRYARPRQIAVYVASQTTRLSLHQLAAAFGRHCHTTILHAIRVVERRREKYPALDQEIKSLIALQTGGMNGTSKEL